VDGVAQGCYIDDAISLDCLDTDDLVQNPINDTKCNKKSDLCRWLTLNPTDPWTRAEIPLAWRQQHCPNPAAAAAAAVVPHAPARALDLAVRAARVVAAGRRRRAAAEAGRSAAAAGGAAVHPEGDWMHLLQPDMQRLLQERLRERR